MLRLKLFAAALLTVSVFVTTVYAADPQQSVGRESPSTRKTGMNANVTTFNFGAGSAEANAVISQGYRINDTIYISGQYSHDMKDQIVGVGDFDAQARQTFENIDRVLAGFNVKRSNIAELVVYLTNLREQSERLTPIMQSYLGDHRPAATVIGTTGLYYPQQLIEIRVVAHTD